MVQLVHGMLVSSVSPVLCRRRRHPDLVPNPVIRQIDDTLWYGLPVERDGAKAAPAPAVFDDYLIGG
jgi:hypothetical protein